MQKLYYPLEVRSPRNLDMSHVDKLNMGCTRRKSDHCFWAPHFRNASAIAGYRRTDDIAVVDIGELECAQKIGISPGPTKKCRYRRTVDIVEVNICKFYCINNKFAL